MGNFIDKTFTVIADILLKVLPASKQEKLLTLKVENKQHKVVALGKPSLGHMPRIQPLRAACQMASAQARRVDHGARPQLGAVFGQQHQTRPIGAQPLHTAATHQLAARMRQIAQQSQHERVAVHNAGRG